MRYQQPCPPLAPQASELTGEWQRSPQLCPLQSKLGTALVPAVPVHRRFSTDRLGDFDARVWGQYYHSCYPGLEVLLVPTVDRFFPPGLLRPQTTGLLAQAPKALEMPRLIKILE